MKTFHVPIEITNRGTVSVEAENQDEAYKKADDLVFWAYQGGMIENNKNVSITDVEVEIDGEELDLDEYREAEK